MFRKVTLGGKSMLIEDLPMSVWEKVRVEVGVDWQRVYNDIVEFPAGAQIVLDAVAEKLTVEKVDFSAMSVRAVAALFEMVEDDLPTRYTDGIPKAEAGDSTPGSSRTSPGGGSPPNGLEPSSHSATSTS